MQRNKPRIPYGFLVAIAIAALVVLLGWGVRSYVVHDEAYSSTITPSVTLPSENALPLPLLEIYAPSDDPHLTIQSQIDPMPTPCKHIIDPPRDAERLGGVYYCTDFALPAIDSESLAIIAGHAGNTIDSVFNNLYKRGESFVGASVLIRTESSVSEQLEYVVQSVYTPNKEQLPYMEEVWGAPGESTAGRLILVTCDIEDDGSSPRNYVAVLQLKGVKQ